MARFDVAVIGLGATGGAALYHLARRGLRAVGIEQFTPGHDRGSSHGETRIIRLSYFEHPSYVPLVRAAVPLWRTLEREAGQSLLQVTGIVELGRPDGELLRTRATPPQVGKDRRTRFENVKDAFAWRGPPLAGQAVLVIDDVATTGATLNACAGALRAAGSGPVTGVSVARVNV